MQTTPRNSIDTGAEASLSGFWNNLQDRRELWHHGDDSLSSTRAARSMSGCCSGLRVLLPHWRAVRNQDRASQSNSRPKTSQCSLSLLCESKTKSGGPKLWWTTCSELPTRPSTPPWSPFVLSSIREHFIIIKRETALLTPLPPASPPWQMRHMLSPSRPENIYGS